MRILIGVALSLLLAAPGAEAAIFGLFKNRGRRCLPKAIDSPVLRPKVKDRHKEGKRGGEHPKQCFRLSAETSGTGLA